MPQQPERYFVGPNLRDKLREVINRVNGMPAASGGGAHATPVHQGIHRPPPRGNGFFRIFDDLENCGQVGAIRVTFNTFSECGPDFVDTESPSVTVKDIGNIVRTNRFAMGYDPDDPLPADTIVECDYQNPDAEDQDAFWRIIRVVECDCSSSGSSSSYSSSTPSYSSSTSSYSSSTPSYSSSTSSYSSSASSYSSSASSSESSSTPPSGSSGSVDPCSTVEPASLPAASPESLAAAMEQGSGSSPSVAIFGFDGAGELMRIELRDLAAAINGSLGSV